MANYSLDIAFDADSEGKSGFDGFLSMGLVALNSDGSNTLGSLALLKPNDKISFNVYDISDTRAERTPTLPNNWLTFQQAHPEGPGNPGNVPGNLMLVPQGNMESRYFGGGSCPRWTVSRAQGQAEFQLPVQNLGRFFFTIEIVVDGKTFGCDPEMIVRR